MYLIRTLSNNNKHNTNMNTIAMAEGHKKTLLFFSFLLTISITTFSSSSSASPPATALVAPIHKYSRYSLYTVTFSGSDYLLDLTSNFLSFPCAPTNPTFPCNSTTCSAAHSFPANFCPPTTPTTDCQVPNICSATFSNSVDGSCTPAERLTSTTLTLHNTDGHNPTSPVTVRGLVSQCVPKSDLKSLAKPAIGIAGFSRSPVAVVSQISSAVSIKKQLSICLPSVIDAPGVAVFGSTPIYFDIPSGLEITSKLSYTALVKNPTNAGHFVGVRGIAVKGSLLKLPSGTFDFDSRGRGGVQLNTAVRYTTMRTDIYRVFFDKFSKATVKVPRAKSVPPFDLCLNSTFLRYDSGYGYRVPNIDLMFTDGKNLTFYGSNSLEFEAGDVQCLAFVDGGWMTDVGAAVVIGGHQMEEYYLQFDMERSVLGFSSMYTFQSGCYLFNSTATGV